MHALQNPGYQWSDTDVTTLSELIECHSDCLKCDCNVLQGKPVLHEDGAPDVGQAHYVYVLTKDGGETGDGEN